MANGISDDAGDCEDELDCGAEQTMKQNNYYQKRSCLRPYLLGCRPKTYLKMGQNCLKRACSKSKNRLNAEKSTYLRSKSSHSHLFTGASSYEMNSILIVEGVKND